MKEDAFRNIVAEWLEEGRLPDLVERDREQVDFTKLPDILAIVGPRRAGKTFYMYQLIQQLVRSGTAREDILFVDFEDYRLTDFTPSDIDRLLTVFHQLAGRYPSFLFFDEVQHLPRWSRVLRTLHNQGRYRIVVSGSNSELLPQEIASELRGRYLSCLMLPLSFPELLRFQGVVFNKKTLHTPARGRIIKAFDDYLREGGFPEVVRRETKPEKRELLQSYYRVLFYRDIIERYQVKSKTVLETMMAYCLDVFSELFSVSRFTERLHGHGISVSKRTVSNYLQYLRDAFFLILIEKFSFSPRKRLMNPKKAYLLDLGFASLGAPFSENRGKMLKNIVAVELFRRRKETFYFKQRHECDFIIKSGTKPVEAIQVCWEIGDSSRKRELQGLAEALRTLKLPRAFVLTYNQEMQLEVEGRTVAVTPVWKWLLSEKE